jgi:hypothetical protein
LGFQHGVRNDFEPSFNLDSDQLLQRNAYPVIHPQPSNDADQTEGQALERIEQMGAMVHRYTLCGGLFAD